MQVRYMLIDNERDGQRIDNFLLNFLKNTPKSRIYKAIRKGEVRVNKGRVKATYRLKVKDCVRIPPISSGVIEERVNASSELMSWVEGCILLESPGLIVLNKPPGIPVHSGTDHSLGIQEVVRKLRRVGSSLGQGDLRLFAYCQKALRTSCSSTRISLSTRRQELLCFGQRSVGSWSVCGEKIAFEDTNARWRSQSGR